MAMHRVSGLRLEADIPLIVTVYTAPVTGVTLTLPFIRVLALVKPKSAGTTPVTGSLNVTV